MSLRDLLFAKAGGGGNPNRVDVIQGTLANPFGSMTPDEVASLQADLRFGGASAILEVDGTPIGAALFSAAIFAYGAGEEIGAFLSFVEPTDVSCFAANWTIIFGDSGAESYSLDDAAYISGTSEELTYSPLNAYASSLPTTLTIYWHPMPDSDSD